MLDQQINEQLGLLEKELSKLKSVTDYIDGAKENSISIITELQNVQQNYAAYTDKIFNLYKQYITDLKQNTEIQVNDGVLKFEITGNRIDTTNREKLVETKLLLERYKKTVEATDNLVKTLESIGFPAKLSAFDNNIKHLNTALTEGQAALTQQLVFQDKEIKTLKTISLVICGLIVIVAVVATIIVLK